MFEEEIEIERDGHKITLLVHGGIESDDPYVGYQGGPYIEAAYWDGVDVTEFLTRKEIRYIENELARIVAEEVADRLAERIEYRRLCWE